MSQPLTTRVVPTYSQLEQEVQALRDEADFYKQELEDMHNTLVKLQAEIKFLKGMRK